MNNNYLCFKKFISNFLLNILDIELNDLQLENLKNIFIINSLNRNIEAERLEILGDGFINFSITKFIFDTFQGCEFDEGFISKLKSCLVSKYSFALLMRKIDIVESLCNLNSIIFIDIIENENILSDWFEILIGFLITHYIKYEKIHIWLNQLLIDNIKDIILLEENIDYKSFLQSNTQKVIQRLPYYYVEKLDNNLFFVVCTFGKYKVTSISNNKKNAEQLCAKKLLLFLNLDIFLQSFYLEILYKRKCL